MLVGAISFLFTKEKKEPVPWLLTDSTRLSALPLSTKPWVTGGILMLVKVLVCPGYHPGRLPAGRLAEPLFHSGWLLPLASSTRIIGV